MTDVNKPNPFLAQLFNPPARGNVGENAGVARDFFLERVLGRPGAGAAAPAEQLLPAAAPAAPAALGEAFAAPNGAGAAAVADAAQGGAMPDGPVINVRANLVMDAPQAAIDVPVDIRVPQGQPNIVVHPPTISAAGGGGAPGGAAPARGGFNLGEAFAGLGRRQDAAPAERGARGNARELIFGNGNQNAAPLDFRFGRRAVDAAPAAAPANAPAAAGGVKSQLEALLLRGGNEAKPALNFNLGRGAAGPHVANVAADAAKPAANALGDLLNVLRHGAR
ncbi:MAG: hypothetical protein JWM25_1981 [Thermoleophilia bacterium]|nr:hypothetical protein [Thermoleophilia bacterium]MCZ4497396.1 hypothetical protein [Thermoleophilia bacterium]